MRPNYGAGYGKHNIDLEVAVTPAGILLYPAIIGRDACTRRNLT